MATAVSDDIKKTRLNPLWLIAAAMTVAAQWNDALVALRVLARFLQAWLGFWREAWRRLFDFIEPYVVQTFPPDAYDMLTLIGTLLATVGIGQILSTLGKSARPMTTYDEVERVFGFSDTATRVITAVAVGIALLIIIFPFFGALNQTVSEAARVSTAQPQLLDSSLFEYHFLSTLLAWACFSAALIAFRFSLRNGILTLLGGSLLVAFAFYLETNVFGISMRKTEHWYNTEIFGSYFTVGMLAIYATALLLPFLAYRFTKTNDFELRWQLVPPLAMFTYCLVLPVIFLFVDPILVAPHTALWAAFCAALSLIAVRSALPLVQLAIIVVSVLAIDFVASVALDIWHSVAMASGSA